MRCIKPSVMLRQWQRLPVSTSDRCARCPIRRRRRRPLLRASMPAYPLRKRARYHSRWDLNRPAHRSPSSTHWNQGRQAPDSLIKPGAPKSRQTRATIWTGVDPTKRVRRSFLRRQFFAPSAGLEPALTAPEADALSAELRGRSGRSARKSRSTVSRPTTLLTPDCPLYMPGLAGPDRPAHTRARPRRILAATMSIRDQLALPVSTACPRWPSGTVSTSRSTRTPSTWSARPGASTGTGRPISPWSRPSRPAAKPRDLAASLVEVLEARPPVTCHVDRGGRPGVRQLPPRRRLAARRPGRGSRPGRGGLCPSRRRPR